MLYDINFIIGILITMLMIGVVAFYFSQKIEEQNEKISAMSMVVRAMAEELSYFRNNSNNSNNQQFSQQKEDNVEGVNIYSSGGGIDEVHSVVHSDKLSDIINVNKIKQNDIYTIDLAKVGVSDTINDINLISVSDCDSDGSDSDSDSGSDSDSDSDSGSDSDSDTDTELDSDSGSDDEREEMEIKTVKLNINSIDDIHDCEIKMDDINSLDNIEVIEDIDVIEVLNISEIIGSISWAQSEDITVKTISVSLESDPDKSNNLDYKKMSLDKLRAIVKEKKLCADSSKLKKNELFKLLQVV